MSHKNCAKNILRYPYLRAYLWGIVLVVRLPPIR